MPTVFIPTPMRKSTGNQSSVQESPGRLADIFGALEKRFPDLSSQFYDSERKLKTYINVFVNGDDIRTLEGMNTPVGDRDEVHIIPAMAGG
ncbi:MAG: MoaD/ThiS family protein [Pseudomonadota bacterium]